MKVSPESLAVDESLCLNYKSIFVSGSDESYIFSLTDILIKNFCKNGFVKKNLADNNILEPDLFKAKNRYVYVCNKYVGNDLINEIEKNNDVCIFYEKNSSKNKSTKQFFSKPKERALVECYELDLGRKKIILNGFVAKHSLVLHKDVYWLLLDLLDNKFSIIKKELDTLLLLDNINNISRLTSALNPEQSTDANKFFFKIHLSRDDITSSLVSSINSLSDFYSYFSYFKIYTLLLVSAENKKSLENKIPKYLFREKQGLINLFDSLNKNKKKLLSSLLYKTESLVRKNPTLYKSLFFRFVLNYKKIIS